MKHLSKIKCFMGTEEFKTLRSPTPIITLGGSQASKDGDDENVTWNGNDPEHAGMAGGNGRCRWSPGHPVQGHQGVLPS